MKNYYVAVADDYEDKFGRTCFDCYVIIVNNNDNLANMLGVHYDARIFSCRKNADDVVEYWIKCVKECHRLYPDNFMGGKK